MAHIRPFTGVHFNPRYANSLSELMCPPYDVISPEQQEAFYRAHPYNIIRLVLGKQYPQDNHTHNRYTRAAETLSQWLEQGTLVRKLNPGLTVYQMEFDRPEGGRVKLDGIICLVKVEDYGKGRVLPHEKTYKGPKQDQLNLLRECRAHVTPIHGLFNDETQIISRICARVKQVPPEQQASDSLGNIHRTWTIEDPEAIGQIVEEFVPKSIFIADGHHRYETALAFLKEMRDAGQAMPGAPYEYVMMYLTPLEHPGLTILPAHRLVKGMKDFHLERFLELLSPYFFVDRLPFNGNIPQLTLPKLRERVHAYAEIGGKFGMMVHGEDCFYLLRLKDFTVTETVMDPEIPPVLRELDVTILRELVMNRALGLDHNNAEGQIEYTPDVEEALHRVLKGEVQIGFILNPTRADQMCIAAEHGYKLPHKSTYFYPKLSSGLVLHVF